MVGTRNQPHLTTPPAGTPMITGDPPSGDPLVVGAVEAVTGAMLEAAPFEEPSQGGVPTLAMSMTVPLPRRAEPFDPDDNSAIHIRGDGLLAGVAADGMGNAAMRASMLASLNNTLTTDDPMNEPPLAASAAGGALSQVFNSVPAGPPVIMSNPDPEITIDASQMTKPTPCTTTAGNEAAPLGFLHTMSTLSTADKGLIAVTQESGIKELDPVLKSAVKCDMFLDAAITSVNELVKDSNTVVRPTLVKLNANTLELGKALAEYKASVTTVVDVLKSDVTTLKSQMLALEASITANAGLVRLQTAAGSGLGFTHPPPPPSVDSGAGVMPPMASSQTGASARAPFSF